MGPKFVDEQPQPGMEGRSTQKKHEKQLRILHFVQDDSAKSAFGVIFRADPSTASAAADSAKDDKEDYLLSCPTNL